MNGPDLAPGPSPFEASATLRRLRVTVTERGSFNGLPRQPLRDQLLRILARLGIGTHMPALGRGGVGGG